MRCDVINNNVIKQCQQSTVPDSPFRIKFPSTGVLVGFSCPRYEKLRSCFLSSFVKIRSAVSEKSKNASAIQMPGRPSLLTDRPKKHKVGRSPWVLASCQVSSKPFSGCRGEIEKMCRPIRGQGGHL